MTTLVEAVQALQGRIVHRSSTFETGRVAHVVACDLMSDALVVDKENILLLTSLVARQSLKTAHVIAASAMVVVNNKTIPDDLCALARELDLTLIVSPLDKFNACVALGKALKL